MLARPLAFIALSLASFACVASPEPVTGEDPLFDAAPPGPPDDGDGATFTPQSCAPDGGATWTDLYRDCFGPNEAACGQPSCHGSSSDPGFASSGFVCGATQETCFSGITAMNSIVPSGGSSTPTTTSLYQNIRKAPPNVGGSMPKMSTFAFAPADLARITTWIANGAKND